MAAVAACQRHGTAVACGLVHCLGPWLVTQALLLAGTGCVGLVPVADLVAHELQ